MPELNALIVFEKVASLRSFTEAARVLSQPKSNVSRVIARLEEELGTRLFQRTTRDVALTLTGQALLDRAPAIVAGMGEAIEYIGSLSGRPKGMLKISAGMGFGLNVLGAQLPEFLLRYPEINVVLDLESRTAELIAESVDVAVRLGPLPDSGLVAVKLGEMRRYLCAAPAYLERRGAPQTIGDISGHEIVEMPAADGRARAWTFSRGDDTKRIEIKPRVSVNEAMTIHRLVCNGAGLGIVSGYVCAPDIVSGRLVALLPEWTPPPVQVSLVFPSRRELSPIVRAFVDYMKGATKPGHLWLDDPLARNAHGSK